VTTFGGFAVAGDSVTFTLSGSPAGACGTMNPQSGTTNSSGQVTSVYISSTTSGFCTLTSTEANTGGSGSAVVDQTVSPFPPNTPFNVAPITFNPPVVPADGATTATASTVVRDATAAAVAGDTVRFSKGFGPGCLGVLLNGGFSATAVTDSSGVASVTYTAGTTIGNCTINATEAFTGSFASGSETQTVVPNTIAASANPSTILANGTSSSTISITVTRFDGTPANSESVVLAGSTVSGQNDCGSFPAAATTNASGQANVVYISTTTVGFCTINVTDPGGGFATVTITQHA
jgi:adhesin/invasin